MPTVEQQLGFRYASLASVFAQRGFRYSNTDVEAWRAHRYASVNAVEARRGFRYCSTPAYDPDDPDHLPPPEGMEEWSPWDLAWKCGYGELKVGLTIVTPDGPKDLTGIPHTVELTIEESHLMQWAVYILDPSCEFSPRKVGGDWEGVMNDEAYDADGNLVKYLVIDVTWGGVNQIYIGVPKDFGWERTPPARMDFRWNGSCIADKLFRSGQTAPTLRSGRAGTIWNTAALQDNFDRAGVLCDVSRIKKRPLRLQQRQNEQWITYITEELEACPFAEWYTQGDTVICYQPAYGSHARWTYDSDCLVPKESYGSKASDNVNQVTIRRAVEGQQGTEVQMFNFGNGYSQTFNPPAYGLQYRKLEGNGVLSDIIMRNPDGEVTAVRDVRGGVWPPVLSANKGNQIAQVNWTWGAPPNFLGDGLPGVIEFTHAEPDREDDFGSKFDPVINVTVNDFGDQDKHGVRPLEMAPNSLLVDSAHATEYGEGYLRRKKRERDPQDLDVPLNHILWPGDYYNFVDLVQNFTEKRYVRRVTHVLSDDEDRRGTRLTGVIYG